jgi:hypothetical protein
MIRCFLLLVSALAVANAAPAAAQPSTRYRIVEVQNGRARGVARNAYDQGYREGSRQGEFDARRGLARDYNRDAVYRDGTLGYDRRGNRDVYRDEFRRGYVEGYRSSYARLAPPPPAVYAQRVGPGVAGPGVLVPQPRPGSYQEPAYARGYSDGLKRGQGDGRDRDAYNPVGQRDYRDGDNGYYAAYGPRDAYKDNYRAGYRAGYEEGYRGGTGRR